ncbi:ATP-binding cassette domain-containing protein [Sphaerimonospora sp. CA-214678]|uniref:ATP-binding cassette domain-containing protein n=1 Tax=Sphaerimonospora sp. CA-214678 TaxID=3240029 RepID=UPI003D91F14E
MTRNFGPVRAVDGIALTIPRGQTVALLGQNGAGKSTTIGPLLGLLAPDSGRAALFGLDPGQAVRQGLVGAMPQEGGLIGRVTVRELLTFVAGTYPAPLPLDRVLELALGAAFNNGSGIAEDRAAGWLRRLRLTPLTPAQVIAGKVVTGAIGVVPGIAAVLLTGALVNQVTLAPWRWLSIVGGLWVPVSGFPSWLRALAEWTPSNGYASLSWHVAFGAAPGARETAMPTAWLVVFGLYAMYGYRRAGRTG